MRGRTMKRQVISAAAFVLALALPSFAGPESWWSDVLDHETVPLAKILENPAGFRGLEVAFVMQFHRLGTIDNPFYTPFEKESYVNFSCWGDEMPLWDKDVYKNDFPYLFVERNTELSQMITKARLYDRMVVVARIEAIFRGKPWIEVVSIEPLEESMTEPALVHLVKAFTLKRVRRWDAAAAEFQLSCAPGLPDPIKVMSLREQGLCLAAADRCEDAVEPLQKALLLSPKDPELARLCKQVKERAEAKAKYSPAEGEPKPDAEGSEPPKVELIKKKDDVQEPPAEKKP